MLVNFFIQENNDLLMYYIFTEFVSTFSEV